MQCSTVSFNHPSFSNPVSKSFYIVFYNIMIHLPTSFFTKFSHAKPKRYERASLLGQAQYLWVLSGALPISEGYAATQRIGSNAAKPELAWLNFSFQPCKPVIFQSTDFSDSAIFTRSSLRDITQFTQ